MFVMDKIIRSYLVFILFCPSPLYLPKNYKENFKTYKNMALIGEGTTL